MGTQRILNGKGAVPQVTSSTDTRLSKYAYALAAVIAVTISMLTLLPLPAPPLGTQNDDKIYHLIAFVALVLPVAATAPRALVWMVPAALLFGGAIELVQPLVNRSRELADFLADAAGVLLGALIGVVLHLTFRRRRLATARSHPDRHGTS